MLKFLAVVLGLGMLIYVAGSFFAGAGSSLGDPVTASATLNLKVKSEAEMSIAISGAANRMRQVMAAGNDPAQRQPLLIELATLHQDMDAAQERLSKLGESPEAIARWLANIRWPEFLALEKEFTNATNATNDH